MILAIFLVSLILALFCLQRKRNWKSRNEKSAWYFFFDKCVEFFVPLTAVTLFYSVLWLLIEGTTNKTTLGWLKTLEGVLDSIESFISYFKFKPLTAALIILGLITLDLLLSAFLKSSSLASHYKDYHKWTKRVYAIAVLLCSFTFFGNQLGEERAQLRLRTDKIRVGYAKVREEAEDILYTSVEQELYEKARSSLPPEVRDYPKNINDDLTALRNTYEDAKGYEIRLPETEQILSHHEERAKQPQGFGDKPVRYDEPQTSEIGEERTETPSGETEPQTPSNLTVESVEKSLPEIEAKISSRARFVSLIKSEGGKQLLCQFPKSFTSAAKSKVFKTVMKNYPILEPIVDIFVGTFDKYVEEKVKKSIDNLANALLGNPEKTEQLASEEARKIVDSVEIKVPEAASEKIDKLVARIKSELKGIEDENQKVSELLENEQEKQATETKVRNTSPNPEGDLVDCYCSDGRYVGKMSKAMCSGPC